MMYYQVFRANAWGKITIRSKNLIVEENKKKIVKFY